MKTVAGKRSGRGCYRLEVVLGLASTRLDEEPVFDPGLQRLGGGALDRRPHAVNGHAVNDVLDGNRIGTGYQVPNGVGKLVSLDLRDRYDLEGREPERAVEREEDRLDGLVGVDTPATVEEPAAHGPRAMIDLNIVFSKPVLVQVERNAAQQDGQRDQQPLLA